jgi:hypothetical protein
LKRNSVGLCKSAIHDIWRSTFCGNRAPHSGLSCNLGDARSISAAFRRQSGCGFGCGIPDPPTRVSAHGRRTAEAAAGAAMLTHRTRNLDTHLTHGCIQLFRHVSRVRCALSCAVA